jgi:hypothetical protein
MVIISFLKAVHGCAILADFTDFLIWFPPAPVVWAGVESDFSV